MPPLLVDIAEISFNSVGRSMAFSAEGPRFDPNSGRYIISHISGYLDIFKIVFLA
jgi:hypothetical protein